MSIVTREKARASSNTRGSSATPRETPPLRAGIVGAGYIADFHIRGLRGLRGVELVAICDVDRAAAERAGANHGVRGVYSDLDEMLGRERLDVAHVLVPPDKHRSVGSALLSAGAHVLFEKPLSTSSADCRALSELARDRGLCVGTSHNFLFSTAYEQLREACRERWLGRIDAIDVVWHKHLPQSRRGPFAAWMLRAPTNVLLEIGPHSLAHVLDLCGEPEDLNVMAFGTRELPNGAIFHERWEITAVAKRTLVRLRFGFGPGYSEHLVRVRGTLASASVDFEKNLFFLHRHRPLAVDLDRFATTAVESAQAVGQAARTLADYARYKARLGGDGAPFQASITRSVRAFYSGLVEQIDPRQDSRFSASVVALGERLSEAAGVVKPAPKAIRSVRSRNRRPAEVLVTGGAGFIGRALVKRLVERDRRVRLVARPGSVLPRELDALGVEVASGSLNDGTFVAEALAGVRAVFHLARGQGSTFREFLQGDVELTRKLAEASAAAGVERFVYSSSIAIYYAGARAGTITEETPADAAVVAHQAYARAKLESERLLGELFRRAALPAVIVRPGIVIGSGGDPRHWGIGMWPHPSVCELWGAGTTRLPLVLVEDVAEALVRCIEVSGIEGESFNLVGDASMNAAEYLDELEKHASVRLSRRARPIWRFFAADALKWAVKTVARYPDRPLPSYRAWEGRTAAAFFDCSKAKRLLGWRPTSDRATLVDAGIRLPALEFVA